MEYFYGVVEDRQDPLKIGRVRVRIHGIHTDEKILIATPDLPWCQVILPTTSAGLSGLGTGHGLVEGSTVFGYFRDKAKQDPIVLGVSAGIPQAGYKESITDELITRSVEKGFNDPRQLTVADYNDTPDGPNPVQDSRRGFGLSTAMDTAPKTPKSITVNYDATGSTIEELTLTKEMLPYYPLYTDDSDYSTLARGSVLDHKVSDKVTGFLDSVAAPVYPYNKVYQSESGHVFQVDDTPTKERIDLHHRSGTFHEIHPDGSQVSRIVNDKYEIVAKDDKVFIAGNADLTVEKGNVTINVNTGNVIANVMKGTTDITSEGKITITGKNTTEIISDTTVKGTLHVTGAQTNDSTIHAKGDISTDAGNAPTLATHKHKTKLVKSGTSTKTSEKGE